jgi:hypothetical protein
MMLEKHLLQSWYSRLDVQFNLIQLTKNREFVSLVPKQYKETEIVHFGKLKKMGGFDRRYMRCHSAQHLQYILNKILQFYEVDYNVIYNLYYSLASYDGGIPKFSPNPLLRNTSDWRVNHYKTMTGYDWAIDVDAGDKSDMKFAKQSVNLIIKLFNNCGVPYSLRFSGLGYHLVVPAEYTNLFNQVKNPNDDVNLWTYLTQLGKVLHDDYSEMVDYSISDSRRVLKLPYSVGVYPDGLFVCWPFNTIEEFDVFVRDDALIKNFKDVSLRGRGVTTFNKSAIYNPSLLLNELGFETQLK